MTITASDLDGLSTRDLTNAGNENLSQAKSEGNGANESVIIGTKEVHFKTERENL